MANEVFTGQHGTLLFSTSTSFKAVLLNIFRWNLSIASKYYDRTIFALSTVAGGDSKLMYRGPYKITGQMSLYLDDTGVFDEAWIKPGYSTATGQQVTNTVSLFPFGDQSVATGKPKFVGEAMFHNWSLNIKKTDGLNTATVDFTNQNEWTMGVQ
jgi:hypothetical protein